MSSTAELDRCPSCWRPILEDHPYSWCKECGEPLPEHIRTLLPSQQQLAAASPPRKAGSSSAEDDTSYKTAERFAIAHPGPLSLTILGACVLLALLTLAGDRNTVWARQIAWGAQLNDEVNAGEWWRLLSAAFLHGSWWHLIANMYALFVVGSVVERAFGRPAFLVIYVLAALGGGIATYCFLDVPSLGASGAIFGLFGAVLWLLWHDASADLPLSRQQLSGLGWWAAYSLFMGFTSPQINNAAHLGGLVTGAAVAALLPGRRIPDALTALCATLLALTGLRMMLSAREMPRVAAFVRAMTAARSNEMWSVMPELDRAVPLPKALEVRGGLRLENGDYAGALHDADALLATGRRGESRRRAHYIRAAALFKLGDPKPALSSLQPALRSRDPNLRKVAGQLRSEILRVLGESELPASVRALRIESPSGVGSVPAAAP